ncbi:MAG: sulfatase-like hydrolase/transferase [Pseudobdellovibrio sp.]
MSSSKLSLLKVWILITVGATGLWSLGSCQKQKQPSYLIIAIDRLSFNSFACSDEKQSINSGLNVLCKEAIRFTHAYTTSTQSAAAMASLLTGLYPLQHKVHRSFDRLDSSTKMVQTVASQVGYQTYFLSGSPSILKKTGLSAGFDLFEDSSFFEKKSYFLDLKYQSDKFLNLIQDSSDPFFAVIYNAELEALNEGESQISSFEKLDEKLSNLFATLKDRHLWDNNYIIVTGLQGKSDYNRLDETPFSNVNSENTRITLFLKPPRSKGDEGIFWKIDSPINLADLGLSLWTSLIQKKPLNQNILESEFPIFNISSIWNSQNKNLLLEPRKILIEAADTWSKTLSLRLAILNKNLLFIEDKKNKVYNTLTDGLESINIANQQKEFTDEANANTTSLRQQINFGQWITYKSEWHDWVMLNREYWSKPNERNVLFEKELNRIKNEKKTQPLSIYLVRYLIQNKRTDDLKIIQKIDFEKKSPSNKLKFVLYETVKQQSLNLALENVWGIWDTDKKWIQSSFILENQ